MHMLLHDGADSTLVSRQALKGISEAGHVQELHHTNAQAGHGLAASTDAVTTTTEHSLNW